MGGLAWGHKRLGNDKARHFKNKAVKALFD